MSNEKTNTAPKVAETKTCSECEGDGIILGHKCGECNGTGIVTTGIYLGTLPPHPPCDACEGRGRVFGTSEPCAICNGTGLSMLSPESAAGFPTATRGDYATATVYKCNSKECGGLSLESGLFEGGCACGASVTEVRDVSKDQYRRMVAQADEISTLKAALQMAADRSESQREELDFREQESRSHDAALAEVRADRDALRLKLQQLTDEVCRAEKYKAALEAQLDHVQALAALVNASQRATAAMVAAGYGAAAPEPARREATSSLAASEPPSATCGACSSDGE